MTAPQSLDLAVIGNGRTAALVDRNARIVWWCFPRFDSDPLFCRLIAGDEEKGFSDVVLDGFSHSQSHYDRNTATVMTLLTAKDGAAVRITDFAPRFRNFDRILRPPQLMRRIDPVAGMPRITIRLRPTQDYGKPMLRRVAGSNHITYGEPALIRLTTDAPLSYIEDETPFALTRSLNLILGADEPFAADPATTAREFLDRTNDYWREWVRRLSIPYEWQDATIRAAITLKLSNFEETGGIVAALTTSLPEAPRSGRTWDYRYCWLRDASFTAHAFFRLGFDAEALAFTQWMTHATSLTYPELQVLYTLHGEASIPERSWPFFEGYRRSQPVRLGNAASAQEQLDVYGEVLDTLALYVEAGYPVDRDTKRWIVEVGNILSMSWPYPDHGIWEIRGEPRHYVHSKVMCWTALDRVERLARKLGARPSTTAWSQAREALVRAILKSGYSKTRRSFVQVLGGTRLDAAALTFGLTGFIDGRDPLMISTISTIQRWLTRGPLVYRYIAEQGTGREEGAFLPCSFWLVQALAAAGRPEEAQELLARLVPHANDLGLFPEEIRHQDGEFLGNFPLALTHVAHLGALLSIAEKA